MKCPKCGCEQGKSELCVSCGIVFAKYQARYFPENIPRSQWHEYVTLTTAPWLEGYRVVETVEIITTECVYGMNVFLDLAASITDAIGGRSASTQNILKNARKNCLLELKKEAANLGANAVIAVDLDYSEFSGQNKSMLFLVASGTAVKVEKNEGQ